MRWRHDADLVEIRRLKSALKERGALLPPVERGVLALARVVITLAEIATGFIAVFFLPIFVFALSLVLTESLGFSLVARMAIGAVVWMICGVGGLWAVAKLGRKTQKLALKAALRRLDRSLRVAPRALSTGDAFAVPVLGARGRAVDVDERGRR